jgi:CRISPR-associated endoribonuclease Cas6
LDRPTASFQIFSIHRGILNGHKSFKLFWLFSPVVRETGSLERKIAVRNSGEPAFGKRLVPFSRSCREVYHRVVQQPAGLCWRPLNGLDLTVVGVERLSAFDGGETVAYRAQSPVVVSIIARREKIPRLLNPENEAYEVLLRQNLVNKFNSIPGNVPIETISPFRFELRSSPRSKLVTIKPFTPEQSKVRGFVFDFMLTCPVEIHQLIEGSGLGEKNSMGFGWYNQCNSQLTDPSGSKHY